MRCVRPCGGAWWVHGGLWPVGLMVLRGEELAEELRRRGFDRAELEWCGAVLVQCSQCAALVINGTACHETGCPNSRRVVDDEG